MKHVHLMLELDSVEKTDRFVEFLVAFSEYYENILNKLKAEYFIVFSRFYQIIQTALISLA